MLIRCPWCGDRDHSEFAYGGDGAVTRPLPDAPAEAWRDYVYFRDNPRGPHDELWQHTQGCRQWLRVRRDVTTHEVVETALAARPTAGDAR